MKPLTQKGQSSIEGALMGLLLVIFVSGFFSTLYVIYASYWVEHIMYESLICYQERGQKEFCVNQALDRIHSTLAFDRAFTMKMESSQNSTRAKLQMKINFPIIHDRIFYFTKDLKV
jgi:hypothetical protein